MTPGRPKGTASIREWIEGESQQLRDAGQWREVRVRQSPHAGGLIHIEGQTYVDFGSNDYLSLSADSRLIDAVRRVVGSCGWGSGASPLVTGYGVWHRRLEEAIAAYEESDAAIAFPTGFAANVAAVTALTGPGDLILSDALNHASIVDGCRLSKATTWVYQHVDVDAVRSFLREQRGNFSRALIVTDGMFSMDGDLAPLDQLAEIAANYDAELVVDEAHATGVIGPRGRGTVDYFGIAHRVAVRVGTLSKALGSVGGFIVGPKPVIDWIRNRGRTQFYSTALPEAAAAASVTALSIVENEPQRRERVLENARFLRSRLSHANGDAGASDGPIIPLVVGSNSRAVELATALSQRGLWVPAIREPTVPAGSARLRISVCHDHTQQQLSQLADALNQLL